MYITASSAIDIYYLTRKYLHNTDQARKTMAKLYELFYILDVTSSDCPESLSSEIKDYEDAVVVNCANGNRMNYIVARNIRDYEHSKVRILLPDELLKIVSQSEE